MSALHRRQYVDAHARVAATRRVANMLRDELEALEEKGDPADDFAVEVLERQIERLEREAQEHGFEAGRIAAAHPEVVTR